MEARKLLVLDLDETLIFATEAELARPCDHKVGHYFIYRRPHLSEFLAHVAKSFEVAVWTASTKPYADAVCEQIFDFEPSFIWARDRCTHRRDVESDTWEHHKSLGKIKRRGYDLTGVIAVDDTPEKYAKSYGNLVRVSPFWGDHDDNELPFLASYLETLAKVPNVRAVEKRGWRSRIDRPAFPA
ncbi:MAG: NLI interacting domain protein [Planctomycetes bacterium]|nr:NLI interacting domain protein [Planctomycetota bacterium]